MAKAIFGNHSAVLVPRRDRYAIRNFYCDVPDASEFLRSKRGVWLEIKSDDVDVLKRKILDSGGILTGADSPGRR